MAHGFETGAALERINVVMDALFWKPGWQQASDEELLGKVEEVCAQPRWVLDGNYTRTLPIKWKRVQLVIWLDPPFVPTVLRVIARGGVLFAKVDHPVGDHHPWPEPPQVQRVDGGAGALTHYIPAFELLESTGRGRG